jgi:hypothetical protein
MRKVAIIVGLLLLATSALAQSSIWFNGSWEDAQARAKAENKLILIDFYSLY